MANDGRLRLWTLWSKQMTSSWSLLLHKVKSISREATRVSLFVHISLKERYVPVKIFGSSAASHSRKRCSSWADFSLTLICSTTAGSELDSASLFIPSISSAIVCSWSHATSRWSLVSVAYCLKMVNATPVEGLNDMILCRRKLMAILPAN